MTYYRSDSIYITPEVMFYAKLRRQELTPKDGNALTLDEIVNGDLRNLYTTDHPEWVVAWSEREELVKRHRREFEELEKSCATRSNPAPTGAKVTVETGNA